MRHLLAEAADYYAQNASQRRIARQCFDTWLMLVAEGVATDRAVALDALRARATTAVAAGQFAPQALLDRAREARQRPYSSAQIEFTAALLEALADGSADAGAVREATELAASLRTGQR